MAAAVVTGAMGTLLPKLGDLLSEEYNLQKGVKGEIMFLKAELESMETALLKVSEAPIDKPPDRQVKLWARDVRELSYDIEDSIDKFMVRICTGRPCKRICTGKPCKPHSFMSFIYRSLNLLTTAKIRHKIGNEIKDFKSRIKEVTERRDSYKVDLAATRPVGPTVDSLRLSAIYKKASELIGTEEKSNGLIKCLMEGDELSKKKLRIVSVVGCGGLGKTTLANMVYERLKGRFHCGAFVSISLNPVLENIFRNMLRQLGGGKYTNINCGTWSQAELISELKELLQDKRYIIVLDDIWNSSAWETIQYALLENDCGSRVITTTRSLDVAKQAGGIYRLEPLSLADSTKLFYQRIFGSEDKCPPDHLAEVSKNILKKCGGVPLAIITIASMLANKNGNEITHKYWSDVYKSMGSGLEDNSNVEDMRRILSVSYHDLPPHLKTCLLYLSLFPEDYEISVKDLILRWIGEGFVHKVHRKTLYEVGEGYIDELVNRSLIHPAKIGHDNKTMSCRVHDMVLDLINFLSNEEHFLSALGGPQPISLPNKIRRLSLQTGKEEDMNQLATLCLSHVRSLTVFNKALNLVQSLSTFPVLRSLDLSGCRKLDNQHCKDICKLFHLRYLNLHGTQITHIPEEIGNLQYLTVLNISTTCIRELPSSFLELQHLLHLHVDKDTKLPDGFGNLKSLQELLDIAVESPTMLQDLGKLTELRVLHISFPKFDESYEKPFLRCLSNLVTLKSLEIHCDIGNLDYGYDNLCPGLQQLCSIDVRLGEPSSAVPRWMMSLCSLSSVHITLITLGEQSFQVLGSIPALRYLEVHVTASSLLQDVNERIVIGSVYGFRCLTRFSITWGALDRMLVSFASGAMQNLKSLHLEFSGRISVIDDFSFGLEHLSSLESVFVKTDFFNNRDSIKKEIDMNPNKPTLVFGWSWHREMMYRLAWRSTGSVIRFICRAKSRTGTRSSL